MITAKGALTGSVAVKHELHGVIANITKLEGNVNVGGVIKEEPNYYDGEYQITPSQEAQTLKTSQKLLVEDIIVNPIPKEYGKVTYNQDRVITIV